MTDMWWLRISCPICPPEKRGDPRYWSHSGCSKNYSSDNDVKIDINGNIYCNGCHMIDPMIKWRFKCENHTFTKLTVEYSPNLTEIFMVMSNMSKNIDEQRKYAKMVKNVMQQFENI